MNAHKFASLNQHRELISPEDVKILRTRAWHATTFFVFVAAIVVVFGAYALPEFILSFSDGGMPNAFLWVRTSILLFFGGLAVLGEYYTRRAWREIHLTHKTIYYGQITEKYTKSSSGTAATSGPHGVGTIGGSGTSSTSYYASLDGVRFSLESSEWHNFDNGDYAEFHCTRPGAVFRTVRVVKRLVGG